MKFVRLHTKEEIKYSRTITVLAFWPKFHQLSVFAKRSVRKSAILVYLYNQQKKK